MGDPSAEDNVTAVSAAIDMLNLKQDFTRLSRRYLAALRAHLKQGARASLQPALLLGRRATAYGLEMLDLAQIHEQAVAVLKLSGRKNGLIKRAEIFFTETLTPIMETHRIARQNKIDLHRSNTALNRRTAELAATNRQLQRGVVRGKVIERDSRKNRKQHDKDLEESLQLQKHLRQLAHQVLAAQEAERKKLSCELQDEIAQTLLGINVRLLSLKQQAQGNTPAFKKEIASA
jgi:signal transduction histidine kinase